MEIKTINLVLKVKVSIRDGKPTVHDVGIPTQEGYIDLSNYQKYGDVGTLCEELQWECEDMILRKYAELEK